MKNIVKNLQNLGVFTSGIVAHHYGSKLLDYKESSEGSKVQALRDDKLDEIANGIKKLTDNCNNITDNLKETTLLQSKLDKLAHSAWDKANNVQDSLNKYSSIADSSNKENLDKNVTEMVSVTEKINKLLEEISNANVGSSTKFTSSIDDLYNYLDNLSLLEESSLLHILIFLVIILTVFNILTALFSNEIIQYFNLVERYPYLYNFFKLRNKLQRYYLMWNIFTLLIICIGGICINLLTIYCLN